MTRETNFKAPWGTMLMLTTILATGILVSVSVLGWLNADRQGWIWYLSMLVLPLAILLFASLYTVRGYRLSGGKLIVQRLIWTTEVDLETLQAVEVNPTAMQRSIRTFGNGGLFCFAGRFRNKQLGPYRAYATDPRRAVVLRLADKVIVVTPDHPAEFAAQLQNTPGLSLHTPKKTRT